MSPLPTSPRSINRQAKLHRLLNQLHGKPPKGQVLQHELVLENGGIDEIVRMSDPGSSAAHEPRPAAVLSAKGRGRRMVVAGAAASSIATPVERRNGSQPERLVLNMDAIKGMEAAEAAQAASAPKNHASARSSAHLGANSSHEDSVTGPSCVFKSYSFTSAGPPETNYDFSEVPTCKGDLSESVLLRPSSRRQWFVCLKELESLAKESLDRRATRLKLAPPSGLPLVYIADRMDIDDPLWGYQVRCSKTGWLQGFITVTVFTTWTRYFEWDSLNPASGMAAARVANSLAGRPDPAAVVLPADETVHQLAARMGVRASDIVAWNAPRFPAIHINSRMPAGAALYIVNPAQADTFTVERKGETLSQLAAKLEIPTADLLLLNAQLHPQLSPATKLKVGTQIVCRDRSAEPDVFLPTGSSCRALDLDGSLARELQTQHRYGDPMTTGVVWPRVAEIGLLAGLGCGKTLVRLVLEELATSGVYDFVVLQATMASVSFYEEMGFVRVGAVARYASQGTPLDEIPLKGYRHWASADESQLEQFGDISYMMALRLDDARRDKKFRLSKVLAKRLVRDWPEVQSSSAPRKGSGLSGNKAGIVAGSAVQVGDLSVNIADGDDARLQLRYEVERVVEQRESSGCLQYLVKWKYCAVEDATWENATSEAMQSEAAKAALMRFRKHLQRKCSDGHMGTPNSPTAVRKRPTSIAGSARSAASTTPGPSWVNKIVRLLSSLDGTSLSPRIFEGGLGEPQAAPVELQTPDSGRPDKEYRFWWIARFAPSTHKCTLLPLFASGRFGGCGRRAGRIRWRAAGEKMGYEREVHASLLQLVAAESVTGAREPEGEVWAIDEADVEHAAREQAAAVRNKRRRLLAETQADTASGFPAATANGILCPPLLQRLAIGPTKRGRGRGIGGASNAGRPAALIAKKKRLTPVDRTCLACTKGKHVAHTCGVRGKRSTSELAVPTPLAPIEAPAATPSNSQSSAPTAS